jgi:hypothetical protein
VSLYRYGTCTVQYEYSVCPTTVRVKDTPSTTGANLYLLNVLLVLVLVQYVPGRSESTTVSTSQTVQVLSITVPYSKVHVLLLLNKTGTNTFQVLFFQLKTNVVRYWLDVWKRNVLLNNPFVCHLLIGKKTKGSPR